MNMLKKFSWSYVSLELYEDHVPFVYPKGRRDISFDTVTSIRFLEGNIFKNPTITFNAAGLIHTEHSALAGLVTVNDGELTVPMGRREELRAFYEEADRQWKLYKEKELPRKGQSNVDQLLKWKELLDAGAISQEEYDKIKAQILNL